MDILEQVKSENKAIRRNTLKQFISAVNEMSCIDFDTAKQFMALLPFRDSYDTCRELVYTVV